MDWTNELKQLESEVRTLPAATMPTEKHQAIYRVLQAAAAKQPGRTRRRRFLTVGLSTACVAAVAVLGVGLYQNQQTGGSVASVVSGAMGVDDGVPKAAVYKLPAVGTSAHWQVELQPSFAHVPASTPTRPRYDYILSYKGQAGEAKNVVLEEHGIGIWKPDGTTIPMETMKVGTVAGKHTIYSNFTALDEVPNLFFKITWTEDGQTMQTEQVTIARK